MILSALALLLAGCAPEPFNSTEPGPAAPTAASPSVSVASSHTPAGSPTPPATQTSQHSASAQEPSAGETLSPTPSSYPSKSDPAPPGTADAPVTPSPAGGTVCSKLKCVALTFDDGPSPDTTPRLLDILAETHTPATFFVLGASVQNYPQIVVRAAKEGHEIGSHSWSHPFFTHLSSPDVRHELERTSKALRAAGVPEAPLVRPPYGDVNKRITLLIHKLGKQQVLWQVDTLDWQHHDPASTLAIIKRDVGSGDIILMHDIHSTTVDAVPEVIAWLRSQGYTLVKVTDLPND